MDGEEEELGDDDHLEEDEGEVEEEEEKKTKRTAVPRELCLWAQIYRTRSSARWQWRIFGGNHWKSY